MLCAGYMLHVATTPTPTPPQPQRNATRKEFSKWVQYVQDRAPSYSAQAARAPSQAHHAHLPRATRARGTVHSTVHSKALNPRQTSAAMQSLNARRGPSGAWRCSPATRPSVRRGLVVAGAAEPATYVRPASAPRFVQHKNEAKCEWLASGAGWGRHSRPGVAEQRSLPRSGLSAASDRLLT